VTKNPGRAGIDIERGGQWNNSDLRQRLQEAEKTLNLSAVPPDFAEALRRSKLLLYAYCELRLPGSAIAWPRASNLSSDANGHCHWESPLRPFSSASESYGLW